MPDRQYPSAVDTWLAVVLIGLPIFIFGVGLFTLFVTVTGGLVAIACSLLTGCLIALTAWPCRYTLTDQSLRIKSGWLEDEVPLSRIRKAEFSRNPLSAPALSLNRIKLTLDDGSRLISPKDRAAFLADLEARLALCRPGNL